MYIEWTLVMRGETMFNRSNYFNYITSKLAILSAEINLRGKLNILDLNIHAETFYANLINLVLDLNLINMNVLKQNVAAIDLIDSTNKVFAQVSATATKEKIEKSLSKEILKKYPGYNFKFISISKDAADLKKHTYSNPHGVVFRPDTDIIDITALTRIIISMSIEKQKTVYDFIRKELGSEIDVVKIHSNLAAIINIIALEDLATIEAPPNINSFQIDKKIEFNNLDSVTDTIDEYKPYFHKVDGIYKEFDKQGSNRSRAVLQTMNKQYIALINSNKTPDEIFLQIIENICQIIKNSRNYIEIPYEELDLCVSILVVDAFIRCKVFKNPEGYSYVTAG